MDSFDEITTLSKKSITLLKGGPIIEALGLKLDKNSKTSINIQNTKIENLSKKIQQETFQNQLLSRIGQKLKTKIDKHHKELNILHFKLEKFEESFRKLQLIKLEEKEGINLDSTMLSDQNYSALPFPALRLVLNHDEEAPLS